VGAGPLAALTISANIFMSLAIDHFGLLRMAPHPLTPWRAVGGALMVAGVVLVAR
jgi:transporter family-2 protein